jgi:hypothetical protein
MAVVHDHPFTATDGTTLNGLVGATGGAIVVTGGGAEVWNNRAVPLSHNTRIGTAAVGNGNYRVSVVVRSLGSWTNVPVVWTRRASGGTYYQVVMVNANRVALDYFDGTIETTLAFQGFSWAQNTDYLIEIEHDGDRHRVWVDGALQIDHTHVGVAGTDGVQLWVAGNGSTSTTMWHFDALVVDTLAPPPVVLTPDATVSNTNWSAVGAATLHAALAAGDSDAITSSTNGAVATVSLTDPVPNLTALTSVVVMLRHRVT